MKVIFEPEDMENVRDLISDRVGVKLNDEQLKEFIFTKLSPFTVGDIVACDGYCGDTTTREMVIDDFSKSLISESWPINGDGEEAFQIFVKKLDKAMKEKGYEPVESS